MTDTPLTPAVDEVPTTIKALNAKVDEIVDNGNEAIAAVRQVVKARDRVRTAALVLAAVSLFNSGLVGYWVQQRCEDDNTQNAKTLSLWMFIINLTADNPSLLTPEQQATQLKAFKDFLAETYAQRDCLF